MTIFEHIGSVLIKLKKAQLYSTTTSEIGHPCDRRQLHCTALQARRGADPSPKIVDHRRGHAKGHGVKWDKVAQSQSSPGL